MIRTARLLLLSLTASLLWACPPEPGVEPPEPAEPLDPKVTVGGERMPTAVDAEEEGS